MYAMNGVTPEGSVESLSAASNASPVTPQFVMRRLFKFSGMERFFMIETFSKLLVSGKLNNIMSTFHSFFRLKSKKQILDVITI